MDCDSMEFGLRKIGSSRTSSASSSLRRRSSFFLPHQLVDDSESESVSEAGDIGDRELQSHRYSGSGSRRLIGENDLEHGVGVPIPEETMLESNPVWPRDHNAMTTSSVSPVSPSQSILQPDHKKNDEKTEVPWVLEYTSCLLFLAVLGILGVMDLYMFYFESQKKENYWSSMP